MRKLFTYLLLAIGILHLGFASTGRAQAPNTIMYQGRLTDAGGEPLYGDVDDVRFRIYANPETVDPNPVYYDSTATIICDTNGVFTIQLGPITDANAFAGEKRYLGIKVGTDDEMTPYQVLTSTLYSFSSAHIADNCVTSGSIADGSITNADINASAAISPSKISGTAATLTTQQTISATKTFTDVVLFSDSTVAVNRDSCRWGVYTDLKNADTGQLSGISSVVEHTTVGGGGLAWGFYGIAKSDGESRYGIEAKAEAESVNLTTGRSTGVKGLAYDGEYAYGVLGFATDATYNYAGKFWGNVEVDGNLSKGSGSFKIDHPLDPENKYLQHSFVESPDMMNVYNGNATLDGNGEAKV
ncbi:MAG: hypothetical protein JSU69_11695, partial [Candidatus Zixiibacteriota bacterium]